MCVSVERATCVTSTSPITNGVSEDTHRVSLSNKARLPAAMAEIIDGNLYIWFGSHREGKGSGLQGGARPSQELVKDGGEAPFFLA